MNIEQLESYNLADAVKFHDELNPLLWDSSEHLKSEIREHLLKIAEDFSEFLGVDETRLVDITISGSNAAYNYTPSSDIDLHLVVVLPDDNELYRELFDAKKTIYNSEHNITVKGIEVELYAQGADQVHHSQGIYSLLNDDWVQIPRRRRADIDDVSVRSKFEDFESRAKEAIKGKSADDIDHLLKKIRAMRQAGLDAHGEFGVENLAFKLLRNSGTIEKLRNERSKLRDQELSLKEREPAKTVTYGYGSDYLKDDVTVTPDGVSATTREFASEDDTDHVSEEDILRDFIEFCFKELKLNELPVIKLRKDPQWPVVNKTFGRYNDGKKLLEVAWGSRHIMDVLRTVAHELTHKHQHERETMPASAGETGSEYENEANARAGILMRDYARLHPEYFSVGQAHDLHESHHSNKLFCQKLKSEDELHEYARALNQALLVERPSPINSHRSMCFTINLLEKNAINEGIEIPHIAAGQQLINTLKKYDEYNKLKIAVGTKVSIINFELEGSSVAIWGFTTPKTITKIYRDPKDKSIKQFEFNNDPSDVWPRKEQAEYNGHRLVNSAFFGSKRSADHAITMLALGNSEHLHIINYIKETNLNEASGYIPTAAEADDPRYEMALSVDIRPGALGKNANKLLLDTDSQGHPQELRPDGIVHRMFEEYKQFKK